MPLRSLPDLSRRTVDALRAAIESQHGGTARFREIVPVSETFNGQPVWEGEVHVFDLDGHPSATRAYAWSSPALIWLTKQSEALR